MTADRYEWCTGWFSVDPKPGATVLPTTPIPPHPTFRVGGGFEGEAAIMLRAGAVFRIFQDEDGLVTGIVVYHETVDPDGTRRGHENDYALRGAPGHEVFVHEVQATPEADRWPT